MLTRLPLRLRYHVWRRGGRPTVLVWGRYFLQRPTDPWRVVTLSIDGKRAGRHVSWAIPFSRGEISSPGSDPMFEYVSEGEHTVEIVANLGGDWRVIGSLLRGETLVVLFWPETRAVFNRSAMSSRCFAVVVEGSTIAREVKVERIAGRC